MSAVLEWVQLVVGVLLILMGIAVACISVAGTFKFKFVLNRMHAAAMNDTLGILFVLSGLIVINGFNFTSLKLLFIICFFWMASPVASHLLARLEVTTDKENVTAECEVDENVSL